jgi:hypothetical protein
MYLSADGYLGNPDDRRDTRGETIQDTDKRQVVFPVKFRIQASIFHPGKT